MSSRPLRFKELVEAIRSVRQGKVYVSPKIGEKIAAYVRKPSWRRGLDGLSQREFELLRFFGRGMTLQECAKAMFISESAASTYRSRIMKKLGLNSTAEIIKFALEHGIVG